MIRVSVANEQLIISKLLEQVEQNNEEYILGDISMSFKDGVIVEQVKDDVFKIHKKRPFWGYSGSSLSNYEALVSFDKKECIIDIKIKKFIFYSFVVWYIFFSLLTLYLMLCNIGGEFFLFGLIIAPIVLFIERRKFKKFIINYIAKQNE